MDKYSTLAEQVCDRVAMDKAAEFYGLQFNRMGYAACPFHSEKTPSFKIQGQYGHCFGCGWNHNVVRFVMDMFGLPYMNAIRKLNSDFSCGLILDRRPTLREVRDAQRRHRQLMAERAKQEAERQVYESLYTQLWDEWCRLDRNRREFAPKSIEDELHPLYVEAVQNIAGVEYRIDTEL